MEHTYTPVCKEKGSAQNNSGQNEKRDCLLNKRRDTAFIEIKKIS